MTTYTYYEIPTIASPQTFAITLAGVAYNMTLIYRDFYAGLANAPVGVTSDSGIDLDTNVIGGWILDIYDTNNNPIVCGIPLVTGIDLLYQYQYLNFGGALVVSTDGNPTVVPTYDTLGTTSHLYFVTSS